jgi:hypothetical protein
MMHGSNDIVVLLHERADAAPLGPSAPVMRVAADYIVDMRRDAERMRELIEVLQSEVARYERICGAV